MSDPLTIDAVGAEAAKKHKLPIGWFIVTGVLLLALIGMSVAGAVHGAQSRARHEATLRTTVHNAVVQKGLTLARAFRNIDPALLRTDGQLKATALFTELCKDPQITAIVLYGPDGTVRAASNLKFAGERADAKLMGATQAESAGNDQTVTASGPVYDADGQRLGAVVITLTEK